MVNYALNVIDAHTNSTHTQMRNASWLRSKELKL